MILNYAFLKEQAILWSMVILAHIPIPMHNIVYIIPDITLLYVVYISILYNKYSFLLLAIIAGAFDDIASGNIVGITSLEFAIAGCYFYYLKPTPQSSFVCLWGSASIVIFICYIARNIVNYIFIYEHIFNYQDFLVYIVTMAFYPFAYFVFDKILSRGRVKYEG